VHGFDGVGGRCGEPVGGDRVERVCEVIDRRDEVARELLEGEVVRLLLVAGGAVLQVAVVCYAADVGILHHRYPISTPSVLAPCQ
jgi:hypothetical protein